MSVGFQPLLLPHRCGLIPKCSRCVLALVGCERKDLSAIRVLESEQGPHSRALRQSEGQFSSVLMRVVTLLRMFARVSKRGFYPSSDRVHLCNQRQSSWFAVGFTRSSRLVAGNCFSPMFMRVVSTYQPLAQFSDHRFYLSRTGCFSFVSFVVKSPLLWGVGA